jgi:glutamate---cysteine ligase / carboxylate-amine ligase
VQVDMPAETKEKNNVLHLFEGYGIELEYMIVDEKTLDVKPICDVLLHSIVGSYVSDVDCGKISYSNELALHVVELKTTNPEKQIEGLEKDFQTHVKEINQRLKAFRACLLPTAAHPWMDPYKEMKLWTHEHNPVYEAYHRIFDCRGHGWANLQSTHINLPFANDKEFALLHGAIRFLLPILPAIAASSPFLEGKLQDKLDKRLDVYKKNQKKVPSITQDIIPEIVHSSEDYKVKILNRIYKDIQEYDPDNILQYEWLNSRGAIARFDRSAIEIRILDIQECPLADLGISFAIVHALKKLIAAADPERSVWMNFPQKELVEIYNDTVEDADRAIVSNQQYLKCWGMCEQSVRAKEIWKAIVYDCFHKDSPYVQYIPVWQTIFDKGSLASRIVRACKGNFTKASLGKVYGQLADCLAQGTLFEAH